MQAARRRAAGAQVLLQEHVENLWLAGYRSVISLSDAHPILMESLAMSMAAAVHSLQFLQARYGWGLIPIDCCKQTGGTWRFVVCFQRLPWPAIAVLLPQCWSNSDSPATRPLTRPATALLGRLVPLRADDPPEKAARAATANSAALRRHFAVLTTAFLEPFSDLLQPVCLGGR